MVLIVVENCLKVFKVENIVDLVFIYIGVGKCIFFNCWRGDLLYLVR